MSFLRRDVNRYLLTGLAGGAGIGFVLGRYSVPDCDRAQRAMAALEALRLSADAAVGIHLLGLAIENQDQVSLPGSEQTLLSRLGLTQAQEVTSEDLVAALDAVIRQEYAVGVLAPAGDFRLSETERDFVVYALVRQGLQNQPYVPPEPELRDGIIAPEVKFGPAFTVVGKIFNEQPDGHGGIWVLAENTPPGTVITVNGVKIKTTQKRSSLTGAVYGEQLQGLIEKPGRHQIALLVPETGIRQVIGDLEVKPRPPAASLETGEPSTVFCEIEQWSVLQSNTGERLRVKTLCGPRSSALYIGDTALATRVKPASIEAEFTRSLLPPGDYPLRLIDSLTGEAVSLGTIKLD
jgi:hypothetical protein